MIRALLVSVGVFIYLISTISIAQFRFIAQNPGYSANFVLSIVFLAVIVAFYYMSKKSKRTAVTNQISGIRFAMIGTKGGKSRRPTKETKKKTTR